MGDPRATPALLVRIHDAHPAVRAAAVEALGDLGTKDAADAVQECLADPHPDVRRDAAWALGALGDIDAIPQLLSPRPLGTVDGGVVPRATRRHSTCPDTPPDAHLDRRRRSPHGSGGPQQPWRQLRPPSSPRGPSRRSGPCPAQLGPFVRPSPIRPTRHRLAITVLRQHRPLARPTSDRRYPTRPAHGAPRWPRRGRRAPPLRPASHNRTATTRVTMRRNGRRS